MLEPYELLIRDKLGAGCFLRRSRDDDALWVSDQPRRVRDAGTLEKLACELAEIGIVCRTDEATRLWRMDLSDEAYAELADKLPRTPPKFPDNDRLLDAYALCRLLLGKPSPIGIQPLCPLRAVLKRFDGNAAPMLALISSLHESCAELIRRKMPLPSAAGGVLALWIIGKEREM